MTTFPQIEPSTKLPRDGVDKAIMLGVSFILASKNRMAELVAAGKLSVEEYFAHSIKTEQDVITLMTGGKINIGPEGGVNTTVADWRDETNQSIGLSLEAYSSLLDKIDAKMEQKNV